MTISAKSGASAVGARLEGLGYGVVETGGGCRAYELRHGDGQYSWITDRHGSCLPTRRDEPCLVGRYSAVGDSFVNSEVRDLDAAVRWIAESRPVPEGEQRMVEGDAETRAAIAAADAALRQAEEEADRFGSGDARADAKALAAAWREGRRTFVEMVFRRRMTPSGAAAVSSLVAVELGGQEGAEFAEAIAEGT